MINLFKGDKNIKKIVSILTASILLFVNFAFLASAAETDEQNLTEKTSISFNAEEYEGLDYKTTAAKKLKEAGLSDSGLKFYSDENIRAIAKSKGAVASKSYYVEDEDDPGEMLKTSKSNYAK